MKKYRLDGPLLAKARLIRDRILPVVEYECIGKTKPAWKCNCGGLKYSDARCIGINPGGGDDYPDQVASNWSAEMRDSEGKEYSCSLSFIHPTISGYIKDAFADIDSMELYREVNPKSERGDQDATQEFHLS